MDEDADVEIAGRLPEGVEIEFAEILALDIGGDHRAGYDAGGRHADHDLGVVTARDLECECARELAKQRPLDLEHSLRGIYFVTAWRHERLW